MSPTTAHADSTRTGARPGAHSHAHKHMTVNGYTRRNLNAASYLLSCPVMFSARCLPPERVRVRVRSGRGARQRQHVSVGGMRQAGAATLARRASCPSSSRPQTLRIRQHSTGRCRASGAVEAATSEGLCAELSRGSARKYVMVGGKVREYRVSSRE